MRHWIHGETYQEKFSGDPLNQPESFVCEEAVLEGAESYPALDFGSWKSGGKMGRATGLANCHSRGYGALEVQETDPFHHSHEGAPEKGLLNGSRALEPGTELVSRSRERVQERVLLDRILEEERETGLVNGSREEEREMGLLGRSRGEEQAMEPWDHIHEGEQAMVLVC
ncbi:hypothetical protein ACHAPT_003378 [Fusarium lateritium]